MAFALQSTPPKERAADQALLLARLLTVLASFQSNSPEGLTDTGNPNNRLTCASSRFLAPMDAIWHAPTGLSSIPNRYVIDIAYKKSLMSRPKSLIDLDFVALHLPQKYFHTPSYSPFSGHSGALISAESIPDERRHRGRGPKRRRIFIGQPHRPCTVTAPRSADGQGQRSPHDLRTMDAGLR
jgi:hypothetical protein